MTRYGADLASQGLQKIMTPAADVFALLRGALEAASVRYAIGGSWASTALGEPRFTNGVDILAGPPATFFADPEGIVRPIGGWQAVQRVIYMPMAFQVRFLSRLGIPSRH